MKSQWGYADTSGKMQILPRWDKVGFFSYDYSAGGREIWTATVQKGRHSGLINSEGKEVIPVRFDNVYSRFFDDGESRYHMVRDSGYREGVYWQGRLIVPVQFSDVEERANRSFVVEREGLLGLYNSTGKMVVPVSFERIDAREGGGDSMEWECERGGAVTIFRDKMLKLEEAPPRIDEIDFSFSSFTRIDADAMKAAGLKKAVDSLKNAGAIERYEFRRYSNTNGTAALLFKNNKQGIWMPSSGVSLLPRWDTIAGAGLYDTGKRASKGKTKELIVVVGLGKFGLIDGKGTTLLDFVYDEIRPAGNNFILRKGTAWGLYLPRARQPLVPAVYEGISYEESFEEAVGGRFVLFASFTQHFLGYIGENGQIFYND